MRPIFGMLAKMEAAMRAAFLRIALAVDQIGTRERGKSTSQPGWVGEEVGGRIGSPVPKTELSTGTFVSLHRIPGKPSGYATNPRTQC